MVLSQQGFTAIDCPRLEAMDKLLRLSENIDGAPSGRILNKLNSLEQSLWQSVRTVTNPFSTEEAFIKSMTLLGENGIKVSFEAEKRFEIIKSRGEVTDLNYFEA